MHVKACVPVPIPADQPEKQWRVVVDLGIFPPADFSLWPIDAPVEVRRALPVPDFKTINLPRP